MTDLEKEFIEVFAQIESYLNFGKTIMPMLTDEDKKATLKQQIDQLEQAIARMQKMREKGLIDFSRES